MGTYTQIAALGARHRAGFKASKGGRQARTEETVEQRAPLCCPSCGTTSVAPGECDVCEVAFVDRATWSPASDLSRLPSGAAERRAALATMAVSAPLALSAVGYSIATLPAASMSGIVAWPVVATMALAGVSCALLSAGAAVVARRLA